LNEFGAIDLFKKKYATLNKETTEDKMAGLIGLVTGEKKPD